MLRARKITITPVRKAATATTRIKSAEEEDVWRKYHLLLPYLKLRINRTTRTAKPEIIIKKITAIIIGIMTGKKMILKIAIAGITIIEAITIIITVGIITIKTETAAAEIIRINTLKIARIKKTTKKIGKIKGKIKEKVPHPV